MIHRWGAVVQQEPVPAGTAEIAGIARWILSPLWGSWGFWWCSGDPAMNRWAIAGRPWGTFLVFARPSESLRSRLPVASKSMEPFLAMRARHPQG